MPKFGRSHTRVHGHGVTLPGFSALRSFPPSLPLVPATGSGTGSWSSTTGGTDGDGAYRLATTGTASSDQFSITQNAEHTIKLRLAGTIQNQINVNFFLADGTYVTTRVTYIFTNGGYDASTAGAHDWVAKITAPAGVALANIDLPSFSGRSLRIYGRLTVADPDLPLLRLRSTVMAPKGLSFQGLYGTNLPWLGDASVTQAAIDSWLRPLRDTYHIGGLRIWGGLDAGMNVDGGGVFTTFKAACLANVDKLDAVCATLGLKVTFCLFTPVRGFSIASDLDRAVMTSGTVRAGHQEAARQFVAHCEGLPSIVAFDLVNEPHFQMAADHTETVTYTPDQIGTALQAFTTGVRAATAKPVVLSAADGPSAVVAFATFPSTAYDIASYHSYGHDQAMYWYQPQIDKPVAIGELGPDIGTPADPNGADDAAVTAGMEPPYVDALSKATAIYPWWQFFTAAPTFRAEYAADDFTAEPARLAMPKGPTSGFAQAADFYDSVGINHHSNYMDDASLDTVISRVQELGLRHMRLGLLSPANHGGGYEQYHCQIQGTKMVAANAARDTATTQPIFALWGTTEEPAYEAARGSAIYTVTNNNGTFLRPLDGPPGTVPRNPPSGTPLLENAGTYEDVGWESAAGLQGPNEPDNNRTTYWDSVRQVMSDLQDAKNSRPGAVVLGGEDYIDSTTGRIASGPAHAPQVPMVGPHLVGNNWAALGDYSNGADIDVGNRHIYWGGHEPNFVEMQGMWASTASYNGDMSGGANGPLPYFVTETGYEMRPGYDEGPGHQRHCPADVSGEYLIRTLIHNYLFGIRRTYLYKISDEFTDLTAPWVFGLCDAGWVRRAAFYAIKNLMTLVGFRQGSDTTPPAFNVTGFSPGANNQHGDGYTSADRLNKLVLKRSDTEYLVILARDRMLWDRATQSYVTVTDPQTVQIALPSNWVNVSVAEPAKNTIQSPADGRTYANPTDGTAYTQLTPSGSNTVSLQVAGLTRVVRVTTT